MMAALLANPSILDLFRRPSLWRDVLAAMQAALVLLMPIHARGGPDGVALPGGAAFSVSDSEALLRQVAHTSFDQPQFIQHWGAAALSSDLDALDDGQTPWDQICTLNFYFGPGLQRMIQTKVKGRLFTKTLSLGGYEIRETRLHGFSEAHTLVEKEERSHFGNGARVKRWTATSPTIPLTVFEYSLSDHLGSDSATYDSGGELQMQRGHLKPGEAQKSERQSYDAWGARRDAETWAPAAGQLHGAQASPPAERPGSNLARGFTGHEMLDDVGLIHMNGRLYDPALGRMCAADPYVQAPEEVQNYNRYSYVLNNPLSLVDPSGNSWLSKIFKKKLDFFKKNWKAIVTVVVVVVVVIFTWGAGAYGLGAAGANGTAAGGAAAAGTGISAGKLLTAAAISASFNGIQTAINGGSLSDVLKSAAIGAVTGAVGAVVGAGMHGLGKAVGSMLQGGESYWGTAVHLAAHGAAGGAMSEALGGSFRDGFIGGVAGAIGGGFAETHFDNTQSGILAKAAISAISGGTASVLTGGKFAQAAFSAGFFYLYNNSLYYSLYGQEHVYDYNNSVNKDMDEVGAAMVEAPATVGSWVIPWGKVLRFVGRPFNAVRNWWTGAPKVIVGSPVAAKEAGSVFPKGYQGGPGAMWVNEGRGLWKLTAEGADKVMSHGRFGTFYRSSTDGLWWAADNAGHGGSAFKVFRETGKGLEWFRDADQFGDFIVGKHKGATGQFIPWKELKGR